MPWALVILLSQELSREELARRLSAPLEGTESLSFDFDTWLTNEVFGSRMQGSVRWSRGKFLEVEAVQTTEGAGQIYLREFYGADGYAMSFGSTFQVIPARYTAYRSAYPLRGHLLPVTSRCTFLAALLFPEAYVKSLSGLRVQGGATLRSQALHRGDRSTLIHAVDLRRNRVKAIREDVDRGMTRLEIDTWTECGGVTLPASASGVFERGPFRFAVRMETTYSKVRRNEDPRRPEWIDDPLLFDEPYPAATDPLKRAVKNPHDREGSLKFAAEAVALAPESAAALEAYLMCNGADEAVLAAARKRGLTSPLIARRAAAVLLRTGKLDEALDVLGEVEDPLRVRIQVERLEPDAFVQWFVAPKRTPREALFAIQYLAPSPAPTMGESFPLVEPIAPPEDEFIADLGAVPGLQIACARRAHDGRTYLQLLKDPAWAAVLGAEPAAVAKKADHGELKAFLVERGSLDLEIMHEVLPTWYALERQWDVEKAIDATLRRLETEPGARGELMVSSGNGDPNQHLRKLVDFLHDQKQDDLARRLLLGARSRAWAGHPVSLEHDAQKLFGKKSLEVYRFSGGGHEGKDFTEAEVLTLLEGAKPQPSDFEAVQTWIAKGTEKDRWLALIGRLDEGAARAELEGDVRTMAREYGPALDRYERACHLLFDADPFVDPPAPRLGRVDAYFAGLPNERGVPLLYTKSPLVLKVAYLSRLAGTPERGLPLVDRARDAGFDPETTAEAYLLLRAFDRAIAVFRLRWADARGTYKEAGLLDELCKLLNQEGRWEDLLAASTLRLRMIPPDSTRFGDRKTMEEHRAHQEQARAHLPSDPFVEKLLASTPPLDDEKERARAEALAAALGSEDATTRTTAEEGLAALGPRIAGVLAPLRESKDLEIRSRVRALLERWAIERALDEFRQRP